MPELEDDDEPYWRAWLELHASRPSGMGVSPIQFTELNAWLDMRCIFDSCERLDFAYVVKKLDDVWLAWARNELGNSGKASH